MVTNEKNSRTLRLDYETDPTQLNGLRARENGWHRLVRYSKGLDYRDDDEQEGTFAPLLENPVLTIVAAIMRKRLSGYSGSFADIQDIIGETECCDELKNDIKGWIKRLGAFIDKGRRAGLNKSPVGTIAVQIRDNLEKSLPVKYETEKHRYYLMLRFRDTWTIISVR